MDRGASRLARAGRWNASAHHIHGDRTAARHGRAGLRADNAAWRAVESYIYVQHSYGCNVFVGHVRRPADFCPSLHRPPVAGPSTPAMGGVHDSPFLHSTQSYGLVDSTCQ